MQGDILVIAEHWNDAPDGVTLQMLTKGRELADAAGVGLAVLVLGHGLDDTVDALREKGMDTIWVLDDPALARAGGDVEAHAIAEAASTIDPGLILVGYSLVGMELAPAIAVKLGVPAMTNCVNAEIEEGAVVVTRPLFDGTQHAKIVLEGGAFPCWRSSVGRPQPSSLPQRRSRCGRSPSTSRRTPPTAKFWK